MCTLIVLNDVVEGYPLVIAANRDERYDRPSAPPAPNVNDVIVAPRDLALGGTWLGTRPKDGWFVAMTNQDSDEKRAALKSRGEMIDSCLRATCHADVAKLLVGLDRSSFLPFNIVFGRPGAMFLTRVQKGKPLEMEPIEQGISIVSNDCWNDAYSSKVRRGSVLAALTLASSETIDELVSGLRTTLADHVNDKPDDPHQALCVHADGEGFGTVSTSIITMSSEGTVEYWYSSGHPCTSAPMKLVYSHLR